MSESESDASTRLEGPRADFNRTGDLGRSSRRSQILSARRRTQDQSSESGPESGSEVGGNRGGQRSPQRQRQSVMQRRTMLANQRRKDALRLEESDEDSDWDEDEDQGGVSGRGTSFKDTPEGAESAAEADGKGSDRLGTTKKKKVTKILDEEEDSPLVTMMPANHEYPAEILPVTKAHDAATQPLLAFPEASSLNIFGKSTNALGLTSEADILLGNSNIGDGEANETDRLLDIDDGKVRGSTENNTDNNITEIGIANLKESGMFVDDPPVWAERLLKNHEAPPESLRDSVDSSMLLARATQRCMRDLQSQMQREQTRKAWTKMNSGTSNERGERRGNRSPRGGNNNRDSNNNDNVESKSENERAPAESRMLRQLPVGPVLKVPVDPVDGRASIVNIPELSKAFGGQVGNWGPDASIRERLGPLSSGHDRKHGSRSILRLHIHQLSILDHPLITEEEKKANELKSAFAVYRSFYEQKTIMYLASRSRSILKELKRLIDLSEEDIDEEHVEAIRGLYHDLVETLPLLAELRTSINDLSNTLYSTWKDIGEIRKDAGFIGTRVKLTVKEVSANLTNNDRRRNNAAIAESKGNEKDESDMAAIGEWDGLLQALAGLSDLVARVQAALYESDLYHGAQSSGEEIDVAGEVAKSKETLRNSTNGPTKPRKPKKGAISGENLHAKKTAVEIINAKNEAVSSRLDTCSKDLSKISDPMPNFVMRVTEEGDITREAILDQEAPVELSRRRALAKTQFRGVIKVNDQVVTKTKTFSLNTPSLTADVLQSFDFRVLHKPYTIVMDLYAMSQSWFGSDIFVASIPIPFPGHADARKTPVSAHLYAPIAGWLAFDTYHQIFDMSEAAANRDLYHANNRHQDKEGTYGWVTDTSQITAGKLLCATEYDYMTSEHSNDHGNIYDGVEESSLALLPPAAHHSDEAVRWGSSFSHNNGLDARQLLPYLSSMDPNDPRNVIINDKSIQQTVVSDKKIFHLSGSDFAVPFGEGGESYDNFLKYKVGLRHQLLQLRNKKPYLFAEPIPNSDKGIKSSKFYKQVLYQNTKDPLGDLSLGGEEKKEEDDVEGVTENSATLTKGKTSGKIKNFLQRVRTSTVAQSRSQGKKKFSTSSTVAETMYFQVPDEVALETLLPQRKRSLKPSGTARTTNAMHVSDSRLLVQVISARNIPLRLDDEDGGPNVSLARRAATSQRSPSRKRRSSARGRTDSGDEGSGAEDEDIAIAEDLLDEAKATLARRANTCMEVRFQEHKERTTSMSGSAPLWKQTISLPFRPPSDDYTPSALSQVRDQVYFTLFDEFEEDDAIRGGTLEGEKTTRTERRFLGTFALPFTTIYNNGRVEGTFRLNTPAFNFGYAPAAPPTTGTDTIFGEQQQSGENDAVVPQSSFDAFLNMIGITTAPRRTVIEQGSGRFIHKRTSSDLEYFVTDDGATYIKIMATLDPLLSTVSSSGNDFAMSSVYHADRSFNAYASKWIRELNEYSIKTRDRDYKVFGSNSEGLNVLLCRYLSPLKPPEGFETIRGAAHIVSLFPYLSDAHSFEESDLDFWCTIKQAWEIGAGDEEEHGTMLYNYLLYLSLNGQFKNNSNAMVRRGNNNSRSLDRRQRNGAYPDDDSIREENLFLVMGKAIPEGDTTYVMMRDLNVVSSDKSHPRNFLLINPCTGYMYSGMDPSCPLYEISTIVTPYNIWANIQMSAQPFEMNFDVLNIDCWRPFFGMRLPPPLGGLHTVQTDVVYKPTLISYAVDVETEITNAIRSGLRRWRSKRLRSTTTFHPDGCSILRDLLPKLEDWKKSGYISTPLNRKPVRGADKKDAEETELDKVISEVENRMTPILRTRAFHGFPLNMPFTDIEDVVNQVKALSIHESQHPEVQFVLAVRAFPLVNDAVSLWVFIGTLEAGIR
jgi:coiled-coil and C2 domain-containing protein 2A